MARPDADPEFTLHRTLLAETHNEYSHKDALTDAVKDEPDEP
jgi:hypothetical protein